MALLEIQRIRIHTFSLRHQKKGGNGTCDIASEEDPEDVCNADFCAQVVKQHARKDGTKFSGGGANSVSKTSHARWIEFSRDNECGGVGTEVEEHLETGD